MNESLISRTTLTELCVAWRQARSKIEQAFGLLVEAEKELKETFKPDSYLFDLSRTDRKYRDYEQPQELIDELKKDVWRVLVDRMELRRILSVKRAEELDKQLASGEGLPEIDEVQILAMLEGTLNNVPQLIEEAVKETFDYLLPRYDNYKTNSQWQVGKRVILSWAVERKYTRGFRVNHHRQKNITALDNTFHALDGKGSVKTTRGLLVDAIDTCEAGKGETDYFKFVCYGNGNLHLEFKRMDLVQKLNLMAGGGKLREEGPV